jgi:hypothetical protein
MQNEQIDIRTYVVWLLIYIRRIKS